MRRALVAMLFLLSGAVLNPSLPGAGAPGFHKVSDHCYYLQMGDEGNIPAVITEQGTLLVDPPDDAGETIAEALENMKGKPVRWVAYTSPRFLRSASARWWSDKGAVLISGARLFSLATAADPTLPSAAPFLIFDRQLRLFPSNVEIRISELEQPAQSGGDAALFVPEEKALIVGELYESARYPAIDADRKGDAVGWIDGVKGLVDSVPVLKSAMAPVARQSKQSPSAGRAAPPTLEEGIAVLSRQGEVSNLQNMKDLLSACQKLKNEAARAIKAGRSEERFLSSPGLNPYRSYGNFDRYAERLFKELSRSEAPTIPQP